MTLKHLVFTAYLDKYDNHHVNLTRIRDSQTLCASKSMRDSDCWKQADQDTGNILTLDDSTEAYKKRKKKICNGTVWHLHLPLDEDLLLCNQDISDVVIDGVVTDPNIDLTPWFNPAFKVALEAEIHKYTQISAEQLLLEYGNPLDTENYERKTDTPFVDTYVRRENVKTVMILPMRCDYASSDDEKYMAIDIVRQQMDEKRRDIQRVLSELSDEILSKSTPIPNLKTLEEAHNCMVWLNRRRASPWN